MAPPQLGARPAAAPAPGRAGEALWFALWLLLRGRRLQALAEER